MSKFLNRKARYFDACNFDEIHSGSKHMASMIWSEADAVDFDSRVEVYSLYSVQRSGKIFGVV